jgi:phosphate transport system permease protein
MKKDLVQKIGFSFVSLCMFATVLFLFAIIFFVGANGIKVISWGFLTQAPRNSMTAGGVAPAIVGTLYLTLGAIIFAFPLGVACAIYLCEYSPKSYIMNLIRISINNLAGVPSVVFGLFGLAVFVKFFGFGVSILAGSLSLGILVLPVIISAAQEALLAVPQSLR